MIFVFDTRIRIPFSWNGSGNKLALYNETQSIQINEEISCFVLIVYIKKAGKLVYVYV